MASVVVASSMDFWTASSVSMKLWSFSSVFSGISAEICWLSVSCCCMARRPSDPRATA